MAKKTNSPIPGLLPPVASEASVGSDSEEGVCYPFDVGPAFRLGARSVVKTQLRGVDAMAAASQVAIESALAVAECQCRVLQEAWELVLSASGGLLEGPVASPGVAAQTRWARWASEKFLSDGRQLAALVGQTGTGVLSVWRDRLIEMIEEIERLSKSPTE